MGGVDQHPPRHALRRHQVDQIWENILTEDNIRDLVKLLDEEMDGMVAEQRQRLETIEEELIEVRRRLDRIWHVIETTDIEMPTPPTASGSTGSSRSGWRSPQRRRGPC